MRTKQKPKKYFARYISLSLLVALTGIFLMPKIAYLTIINKDSIINLSNQERLKNDCEPLTENKLLTQAAYEKGRAILDKQLFQHEIDDNKFSYWIKKAGYDYYFVGENLAIDFITAEGVVRAWMGSPSHKENIINESYSEIGVAVLDGFFNGKNTILVVQIFGSPANEHFAPATSEEPRSDYPKNTVSSSNTQMPAGMEGSLFHSQAIKMENSMHYLGYLPPSPFQLASYNLFLEISRYPEKWIFMFSIMLMSAFLIFYYSSPNITSKTNFKIITKKTKRSKPSPV
jgi:hypothetical protein